MTTQPKVLQHGGPVPPAPYMTKKGECSDCRQKYIEAGDGNYKICPKCYAVLWHTDWAAEEKRLREMAATAARAMQRAAALRKAQKTTVEFRAEDLIVVAPTLSEPDVN
jgi:hypothetical protein